jgi:DNA-binding NtrC family response regulator
MGGKRCLEEILKLNPQAKVIITTGYGGSDLVEEALRAGAIDVLNKPFRAHEMAKMIRRVLDEKSKPIEKKLRKNGVGLRVVS